MNELFIRIMASLNRATSRANIQKDVTQLERTPFIIRLQGQLDKSRTAARLRRDLQQAGKNQTISVDAKVSRSSLERSLDEARQQIHTEPIEIPITADSAALQNAGQAQRDIINSGNGLRNVIQNYVNWNRVLDLVVQAMKKAVSTSSELAKAQTELQIVTGKSNSEMQSLMSGYNALAQDLSVTTTDITSAADEWLRTGKSISDTEKLITDSTILAKIGQLDTAEATKYLTSMMKGFKVETDNVIGIVDRLNAVDMAAAVTSGGLAEAMSKCANSAEIANISMDSLVGYIAAVKEVTQDSDSVVGNAFKSMFSRMGNVKLGKFIDENGEDISGEINNVEKLLSHFGNPVGLIVTALTSATMIISACTEKQNEYNQKIQENAEQAKQEMSEISDLYSQYRDLSKEVETDSDKKTDLIKVTDDLLEKLGYEKSAIDDLIEKYGNLDDAINAITLGGLQEAEGSLKQAYGLAESSLAPGLNPFEDIFSTNENQKRYEFNFQGAYKSEIESMLKKSGLLDDNSRFSLNMGKIRLNGNVDSIDDMVKNYQDLSDMIILLNKSFSSDELADDGIYQALVSEQTILKNKVDAYNSAISDLNDNIAQQQILTSLMGKELPSTQEEFDKFKDSLLESAESSEEWSNKFVGGTDSAKEAIISALKKKPEFIEFFKNEIPDATDDADDGLTRVAETISNLSITTRSFRQLNLSQIRKSRLSMTKRTLLKIRMMSNRENLI